MTKPVAPRTFSSIGKVSKKAVAGVFGVASVLALTAGVAARAGEPKDRDTAVTAARHVLAAVDEWQKANQDGCPTLSTLVESGKLDRDARVEDAWGNRFRVVCDGTEATVRSAGPDRKMGTGDDLRVGAGT